MSGNSTEKFIGFFITARNEFNDEENGHFISPLPNGTSRMECKNSQSQMVMYSRIAIFTICILL